MCRSISFLICAALFAGSVCAEDPVDCFYKDDRGVIKVTDSREKVPLPLRPSAHCEVSRKRGTSVRPNQIELQGNVRSVDMASPLGRIMLRWPRSLEKVFGRTPERALAEAARTASRALRSGGFPTHVSTVDMSMRVVFLDRNLPDKQISMQIVNDCHPGWMMPPADIFIVGQVVSAGCPNGPPLSSANADKALAKVLLHEIGHAVEYAMLRGNAPGDGVRGEGFASWFEGYASRYSTIIPNDESRRGYSALGIAGLRRGLTGVTFGGSPFDYGVAFLYFQLLTDRRGVAGMVRFYDSHIMKGENFSRAFRQEVGLNDDNLRESLLKIGNEIVEKGKRH